MRCSKLGLVLVAAAGLGACGGTAAMHGTEDLAREDQDAGRQYGTDLRGAGSATGDSGSLDSGDLGGLGALGDLSTVASDGDDSTPDVEPDGGAAGSADLGPTQIVVGGLARVTATELNLRTGPGTTNAVVTTMPCGSTVMVVGGPTNGWWSIDYQGTSAMYSGWSSGTYLVAEAVFSPDLCAAQTPDGGVAFAVDPASIFDRAKLGVGYSYYWGHGSWRADGAEPGACMGTCPSCTHTDQYGADCSGFVAKCWQIPTASALTTDLHPYSTYDFVNSTTHWSVVQRSAIHPADALTYNTNGEGHIMLFESGANPWGNIWTYEARGCATGIVHNLRVAGTAYITIRREGL